MAHITELFIYPIKGARGQSRGTLEIDSAAGVVGDRQYAIKRRPSVPDEKWLPKGMFFVSMNDARMAREPSTDTSLGCLTRLADRFGVPGEVSVADTEGMFNLTDSSIPTVSFLNLATVRALGTDIDPARFRMNVWLEGLEPFAELTWVNQYPGTREITVGGVRMRIHDACERCKAIEASPDTGRYDRELRAELEALMQSRGYVSPHRGVSCVMGVLACPLSLGSLTVGNSVELI